MTWRTMRFSKQKDNENILTTGSWLDDIENSEIFKTMKRQRIEKLNEKRQEIDNTSPINAQILYSELITVLNYF